MFERPCRRKRSVPLDGARERIALQVLHHEVVVTGRGRPEVGDVDDVVVAYLVDRLRLVDESGEHLGASRKLGEDRLQGDLASDDGVFGEEDGSHPALAEHCGDAVIPDGVADVYHVSAEQ